MRSSPLTEDLTGCLGVLPLLAPAQQKQAMQRSPFSACASCSLAHSCSLSDFLCFTIPLASFPLTHLALPDVLQDVAHRCHCLDGLVHDLLRLFDERKEVDMN